jgi:hypothetical protein
MNGDLLYAILMSFGWLFLVGWLALLLIACGLAFRSDDSSQQAGRGADFSAGMHQAAGGSGRGSPWKVHLRG